MLDAITEYVGDDYRKKIAYRLVDRLYWNGQARGSYIPIGLFGYVSQMSKKNMSQNTFMKKHVFSKVDHVPGFCIIFLLMTCRFFFHNFLLNAFT